jgi:hypothetical protein
MNSPIFKDVGSISDLEHSPGKRRIIKRETFPEPEGKRRVLKRGPAESEEKDKESIKSEFLENMKNPEKVKRLSDVIDQSRKDYKEKTAQLSEIKKNVKAPDVTKQKLIDSIDELGLNAYDLFKLNLSKKDKGTLKRLWEKFTTDKMWSNKYRPGKAVDFSIDD